MKIRILRSAERSIADGIRFYDSQEAGLGAYFLNSITTDLRSLRIYAGVHPKHKESYYRMVCTRFPYSIYYWIEGSVVSVFAILDDRRDPTLLEDLLSESDS